MPSSTLRVVVLGTLLLASTFTVACSLLISTSGLAVGGLETPEDAGIDVTDAPSGTDGPIVPAPDGGRDSGPLLLAAGRSHTCAAIDDRVSCWGANAAGQLGDGTMTLRLSPVAVTGLPPGPVTRIGAGYNHSCAIVAGDVWCWGTASSGAVGPGASADTPLPVKVTGLPGPASDVGGGENFSCAHVGARVYCWGKNDVGELGDGQTSSHKAPTAVLDASGILDGVTQLSVGGDHSCVLKTGGSPLCWGHNDEGVALGNPAAGPQSERALAVVGLPGPAQSVRMSGWHGCAIVNGAAWCWGRGTSGELGNSASANSVAPVAVTGHADGVTLLELAGGPDDFDATCAVRTGQLSCWGAGKYFRLGDGLTASRDVPFNVTTLPATVVNLVGGDNHWCAQLANGELRCWGRGTEGQLGDGAAVDRAIPVPVSGF